MKRNTDLIQINTEICKWPAESDKKNIYKDSGFTKLHITLVVLVKKIVINFLLQNTNLDKSSIADYTNVTKFNLKNSIWPL